MRLEVKGDAVQVTPRGDLCLHVSEKTFGIYDDVDHTGGWKSNVALLSLTGAAATGVLFEQASVQAGSALPAIAMTGNPYVPVGTKSREDWENSATILLAASGGLVLTGVLAFALNWWSSSELKGETKQTAARLADCDGDASRRLVVRPSAVSINSKGALEGQVWHRGQETTEELPLRASTQRSSLSASLAELLAAAESGKLPLVVHADVVHALAGGQVTPLGGRWQHAFAQPVPSGDANLQKLVALAARQAERRALTAFNVGWDAGLGFTVEAPCAATADGFSAAQRAVLIRMAAGELLEQGDMLVAAHAAPLTALPLGPDALQRFGQPDKSAVRGAPPKQMCVGSWAIQPDLRRLDAWMAGIANPAKLPVPEGLGSGKWHSEAARGAAAVATWTAVLANVEGRIQAIKAAAKDLSQMPHGLQIAGADQWPLLSTVAASIRALQLDEAKKGLIGAVAVLEEVLCEGPTRQDAACKAFVRADEAASGAVQAAAVLASSELVGAAMDASACEEDLALDVDDDASELVRARCLSGAFLRASSLFADGGLLPNRALAGKLTEFEKAQVNVVRGRIAKAKREQAAAEAEKRREEAREWAEERRQEAKDKAEERRQEARDRAAERSSRRDGGGGGGGYSDPCARVRTVCCETACNGVQQGDSCSMVRASCLLACLHANGCGPR